jgi:hypothetical protein
MNKIIMIIISPRTLLTLNCKPSASSLWGRGRQTRATKATSSTVSSNVLTDTKDNKFDQQYPITTGVKGMGRQQQSLISDALQW